MTYLEQVEMLKKHALEGLKEGFLVIANLNAEQISEIENKAWINDDENHKKIQDIEYEVWEAIEIASQV